MKLFDPKLPQLAPAIVWLAERGVGASRLAGVFGTTPGHIRVLAHRGRYPRVERHSAVITIPSLDVEPSPELRGQLRIRPYPDEAVPTLRMQARMDWLENEIASRHLTYSGQYRFLDGAASLRALLPYVGRPANTHLIGLRARLHQHIAWFYVHSGFSAPAVAECAEAIRLSEIAYQESGASAPSAVYMQQIVDSALIGSQASLISRQLQSAWQFLELAEQASERINIPIGSDQYRQRGVALFQQDADDAARRFFGRSMQTMEKLGEAQSKAHLLMYGPRYTNLLQPINWEGALEVLDITDRSFSKNSNEYAINASWTAACGLAIDSSVANLQALELLEQNYETAKSFAHRATVFKLLRLTPELKLPDRLRYAWIRWALEENAFRKSRPPL